MNHLVKVNKIIWHCTATANPEQWNRKAIQHLHTSPTTLPIKWGTYNTYGNGWAYDGYHEYIMRDGSVELGRPQTYMGAGAYGHNSDSIHLALHGLDHFEDEQIIGAVKETKRLIEVYGAHVVVLGHKELDDSKTCPNYDMDEARDRIYGTMEIPLINIENMVLPDTPDKVEDC